MTNKFLVVKLDQYAGNVDELVCVALTGWGADRYGSAQAKHLFDGKVASLLDRDEEWPEMPVEFAQFETEYGLMPYALDSSCTNNLRIGIDQDTERWNIMSMLDIWGTAYGDGQGFLKIEIPNIHRNTITVRVLGFELVTVVEHRETLR